MKEKKEEIKGKVKGKVKENINLMTTPLMGILPGQISFFVLLSILPVTSLVVLIFSRLSLNFDIVINFINHYIPDSISKIILPILTQQKVNSVDIIFIVIALYVASHATHSIIVASTEIYDGKQKDYISTRVKAVLILLFLIFLGAGVIGLLTIGAKFLMYLSEINGNIYKPINFIYQALKWPFAFFMVFFAVKVIYTIAPNKKVPSSTVNKGALLTSSVWIVSTYAFSFYITNIANYKRFYGNLSSLIILMIWVYWLCYIFTYGMTINKHILDKKEEGCLNEE